MATMPQNLRISNQADLREYRRAKGVSLEELDAALGRGFSRGRLSMAERGLCHLDSYEITRLVKAIDRIGELHTRVRDVKALVSRTNLKSLCDDLRF
jgi:hypothetical protein